MSETTESSIPLKKTTRLQTSLYESLDFEPYLDRNGRKSLRNDPTEILKHSKICKTGLSRGKRRALLRWLFTFVIGLITAYIAIFINFCTNSITKLKFSAVHSAIEAEKSGDTVQGAAFGTFVGINFLLVSFSAGLVLLFGPHAAGSGIPEIKCYLNGVCIESWMSFRTLLCKVFGIIFSVSGGMPVGKEGPMIHSGAIVASLCSKGIALSASATMFPALLDFRNEHEKRDFVTCGSAAGVAAAFGAPIGGVLFAMEEGSSFLSPKLMWRSFFCAMIASFVLFCVSTIDSGGWVKNMSQSSMFSFGHFSHFNVGHANYVIWELSLFACIGATGGLLGALFNHVNISINAADRKIGKSGLRKYLEVLMLSLLICSASYFLPLALGTCITRPIPTETWGSEEIELSEELVQFYCPSGEFNDLATLFLTEADITIKLLFHFRSNDRSFTAFSEYTLFLFFAPYFTIACLTFGRPIPSGLFVPCLLSGAAIGRMTGRLLHNENVRLADAGTYSLMGAAAVLGGMTRMTISLTVILIEATGDVEYGLPLMLVLMIARWVGNIFNGGLYEMHIQLRQVPHLDWNPPREADSLTVGDVMVRDPVCFRKRESAGCMYDTLFSTGYTCYPVTERVYDSTTGLHKQLLEGTILRKTASLLLRHKEIWNPFECRDGESDHTEETTVDLDMTSADWDSLLDNVKLTEADRNSFINLDNYVNPAPYIITPDSSASQAYRLFRTLGLRCMCVVTKEGELIGMVTRRELHTLVEHLRHD